MTLREKCPNTEYFLVRIWTLFMQCDIDLRRTSSHTTDLQVLHHENLKHSKNPIVGYLNIYSLQNKLTDLRVILKYLSLDYFVLSETKLNESFPNAQYTLDSHEIRARRNRNKFGGGVIEYVRKCLICKRIVKYEVKYSECTCSEITFSKKKWVIFSIYRPPIAEMTISLTKVTSSYENILVMGDFKYTLMQI